MKSELHLRIAGVLQIALALFHFYLARHLKWREDSAKLSPVNRQIFWVHTFFIMLVLMLFGLLSCLATGELAGPGRLPKLVLGGIGSFWFVRLVFQFFVYDSALWRGNRLNTWAHGAFSLLWAYFTYAYFNALLAR